MIIAHVDADAFYASVEIARDPKLGRMPMYVGAGGRGVVLSANYLARQHGVRSGMSAFQARRLCPTAVAVQPDFSAYEATSKALFEIFLAVTPRVQAGSMEEAYLDITGAIARYGSARALADNLRATIADEQRITCSIGIAPAVFVAKLASKQAKPDGVLEVSSDKMIPFLHGLPVSSLNGVGAAMTERLASLGIVRVGQIAHTKRNLLVRALGERTADFLLNLAWGIDPTRIQDATPQRCISGEHTFAHYVDDPEAVRTELLRVASGVARRLRRQQVLAKTVTLTVRLADFRTHTRSITLAYPTDLTGEVYQCARQLYQKLQFQRARVREVGIATSKLVPRALAYQQFTLYEPEDHWREAEQTADSLIYRFGPKAVQRARVAYGKRPGS